MKSNIRIDFDSKFDFRGSRTRRAWGRVSIFLHTRMRVVRLRQSSVGAMTNDVDRFAGGTRFGAARLISIAQPGVRMDRRSRAGPGQQRQFMRQAGLVDRTGRTQAASRSAPARVKAPPARGKFRRPNAVEFRLLRHGCGCPPIALGRIGHAPPDGRCRRATIATVSSACS